MGGDERCAERGILASRDQYPLISGTMGTRVSSGLMLGKSDAGFGAVSIAEAAVFSRALSTSELQTVATSLRANHAALIAAA